MYEFIYKIASINPLTPSLFAATATTEATVEANVAGVTAIAAEASVDADASTTSSEVENKVILMGHPILCYHAPVVRSFFIHCKMIISP